VRSRAIERKLRGVESLPVPEADTLLGGFGDGVDEFSEVDIEFS
jgi:DNA recombination protein RmuC